MAITENGARAPHRLELSIEAVERAADEVADRWRHQVQAGEITGVHGIPRGGLVPAAMVAGGLGGIPMRSQPGPRTLVVDDLVDSGATFERLGRPEAFDALFRKEHSPLSAAPNAQDVGGQWVVFPWEQTADASVEDAVRRILQFIGEDPTRPGLLDTPGRVARAFTEMTEGYGVDVAALLAVTFPDRCDEMVVVRGIDFHSLCEHHLLGFSGTATVAYVPGERVVGLSKIARLVEAYARRLQVQERLTQQIANAMVEHLHPEGVGVVVRAHHSCMGCRGVRKPGAEMITSSVTGLFKDDARARAEFLALAHGG